MEFLRRPYAVPVIGVVGAPSSGKTTLVGRYRQHPSIITVPEAPTLLHEHGLWHPCEHPDFDLTVDQLRWLFEFHAVRAAYTLGKRAVMTDRIVGEGVCVYSGRPDGPHALHAYDLLIYLEIAPEDLFVAAQAVGQNGARSERVYAEAKALDQRMQAFVARHHNVQFVMNEGEFETKLATGREIIDDFLRRC